MLVVLWVSPRLRSPRSQGPLGWIRQLGTRRPTDTESADMFVNNRPATSSNSRASSCTQPVLLSVRNFVDCGALDNGMTSSFVWIIGGRALLPITGPTLISARFSAPK